VDEACRTCTHQCLWHDYHTLCVTWTEDHPSRYAHCMKKWSKRKQGRETKTTLRSIRMSYVTWYQSWERVTLHDHKDVSRHTIDTGWRKVIECLRHFLTERYSNWISRYLDVSPSWCRHFQYSGFLTGAPTRNFARKRVKTRYLTLFCATKNSVVIWRASLL